MTAPNEWFRTFFSGAMADGWLAATSDEQTRQEADFVQETLGLAPPARLLDVPCGGGRHSLALAARGYDVTGVDISERFLAVARAQPVPTAGRVTWEYRDMRDLPWPAAFDGACCLGNSFAYCDDQGNADFLRAVARALKPGARFVLHTAYLTEGLLPVLQERVWAPVGDKTIWLWNRRYDPTDGRLYVEYTTIQDGKVEKWPMSARLYTYREVRRLAEEAGFTDLQGYASLSREPFTFGSRELLLLATRKSG
jgi:SAM-dependent methyltransferase